MWFFLILGHFYTKIIYFITWRTFSALNQRFLHMETREELEERIKAELLDFIFNECSE